MAAGLPDGDLVGLPCLFRADRRRLRRNQRDVATAGRTGVLHDRHRMQIDDTRRQLTVLLGRRRIVNIGAFARQRVIEGPVLRVALSALHQHAVEIIECLAVGRQIARREVEILLRHAQFGTDAVEAELFIAFRKGERMVRRNGFAVFDPFVHAPEMGVQFGKIHVRRVHDARHERQLLRRANRAADTARMRGGGLLPSFDIFQSFSQIELFNRVIHHDFEARAAQLRHVFNRQTGDIRHQLVADRRIIPPVGSHNTLLSHLKILHV